MLFRNCAGGIVFCEDRVLLLKNEKDEWVLPKGAVHEEHEPADVAMDRVLVECGVNARVLENAGETDYEFYSLTRKKSVNNRVQWFIMETDTDHCKILDPFTEAGFFEHDDALTRITYTQDRSLLTGAWEKYREIKEKL